jgi:dTDP-4-dehydrorhamnose reductase
LKFLICGRNGQLATAFRRILEERSADYLAPEESDFDITDPEQILAVCDSYRPEVIINCAAYNLVDRAEEETDTAFSINASGPGLLARAAEKHRAFLVHFSSDYVFDGSKESGLYEERDAPNPINQYGKSKLRGEELVREVWDKHLIFRLSWVFGEGKQNFIHKLLEWAKTQDYLKIVCDEFSVPTYAHTAAVITLKALEQGISGLYHLTNTGYCSRYEWASVALGMLGMEKFIRPVTSDRFKLPAERPRFTPMNNGKISAELGVEIPHWKEGVQSFVTECLHE